MHLTDGEVDRLSDKLTDFTDRNPLDEILADYKAVLDDYRRIRNNWEEACSSRDRYKQEARSQDKNPFALVLVDGDGYIFDDTLVRNQAEGGKVAAQRLHAAIKADLQRKGLEHCQVMIRVYANVAGLSKALASAGLAGNEARSLGKFIAGFNRQYGLVDFVDAGELKENADFKMRELLRLYGDTAQCKHIYFAGCHDVGYISELTPYANNSRCTLLRSGGTLSHPEFIKLGLGSEQLPGVFRTSMLPTGRAAAYAVSREPLTKVESNARDLSNKPTSTEKDLKQKTICTHYPYRCKYGKNCKFLHIDKVNNTQLPLHLGNVPPTNGSGAYEPADGSEEANARSKPVNGVRSESDFAQSVAPDKAALPKKADIPAGKIVVNSNNHRLDPQLFQVGKDVIDGLHERSLRLRLCNNYQLNGQCDSGPSCKYDHSPIDDGTRLALERLARSLPCSRRGGCRLEFCTSGHICQESACQHYGGKKACRMPYAAHFEKFEVASFVPAVVLPSQKRDGRHSRSDSISSDDTSSGPTLLDEDGEVREGGGISILPA
jgi:hypothetical protein